MQQETKTDGKIKLTFELDDSVLNSMVGNLHRHLDKMAYDLVRAELNRIVKQEIANNETAIRESIRKELKDADTTVRAKVVEKYSGMYDQTNEASSKYPGMMGGIMPMDPAYYQHQMHMIKELERLQQQDLLMRPAPQPPQLVSRLFKVDPNDL